MRMFYGVTADGELIVNKDLKKMIDISKFTHVIEGHADDETTPRRLYEGYDESLMSSLYPGSPVLTYFDTYPEWKFYQPQTYKYMDTYKLKRGELRGTLTGGIGNVMMSAYHIFVTGIWKSEKGVRELPNTPCYIHSFKVMTPHSRSSISNQPAYYVEKDPLIRMTGFLLDKDVGIGSPNLVKENRCLFFDHGTPTFVRCDIVGVVSGNIEDQIFVAPLLEVMPQRSLFYTGSTSGTQIIEPIKEIKEYAFAYEFDEHKIAIRFKKGWLFRGVTQPGDSGSPVFVLK